MDLLHKLKIHCCPHHQIFMQDNEKKQKREPKETAEELQDCEMVFADF